MNKNGKTRNGKRGGAALMIALGVASLLALGGAANVAMVELRDRQTSRQLQADAAKEANRNSIELLAQLLEKQIIVGFYVPGTPPTVAAPPSIPLWEDCAAGAKTCGSSYTLCSGSSNCVPDDPSTDGVPLPATKKDLLDECKSALPPGPDCSGICKDSDCAGACKGSSFSKSDCTDICKAPTVAECKQTCQDAIPPPPACKLCVPDPDSKDGCEAISSLPTAPPNVPPTLDSMGGAGTPFDSGKNIFLTFDPKQLTALPPATTFVPGYLPVARLNRKLANPKRLKKADDAADQRLSSGAIVSDTACAKSADACLSQESQFGNVQNSAKGGSGSVEILTSTVIPGILSGPPVVSRAKIQVAEIGQAPLPTCSLTAAPNPVFSNADYAGNMWTVLTLTAKVNPNFPGLITNTNIAGVVYPGTSGARVVPYPYGATWKIYQGTVTGPGGSSSCGVTVSSVCLPRSPVCVPHKCWYPVDNFPRCKGWIVCPDGGGCWYRGEVLGCFAPETRLDLAESGERKSASLLKRGDELWNPVRKKLMRIKSLIVGPEAEPLVEIGFGDRRVRVSTKHPMVTAKGVKRADEVNESDEIQGADLQFHRVTHLTRSMAPATKQSQTVVNFELDTSSTEDEDHFVVADGIVTGDYYLQLKLARRLHAAKETKRKGPGATK